jgi:hypothetical protein
VRKSITAMRERVSATAGERADIVGEATTQLPRNHAPSGQPGKADLQLERIDNCFSFVQGRRNEGGTVS